MHPEIQTALNNYRVDQNNGHSETASYIALKSACEKHGVDITSLFRPKGVTIKGSAKAVMTGEYGGPYVFQVFDHAAVLPASMTDGVTVHDIEIEKHFDLMPGVSVVDHRQAA